MIVRTYGRRSRCIGRSHSDSGFNEGDEDSFQESFSQESPQEIYSLPFSSQDSSPWSFDSDPYGYYTSQGSLSALPPQAPACDSSSKGDGVGRKSKKPRNLKREERERKNSKTLVSKGVRSRSVLATSTLMEAQEFGEMMEHVDELNFALDGLRRGQQPRIRRASLLSLLSICATAAQRRRLRTQGMAKTIIDAILGLSFDDPPSTLAAAALFYVLAYDGQDERLLDSPICIRFLLKLLKPPEPDTTDDKAPTIGCKILALHKDPGSSRDLTKKIDASSAAVISKVQEILLSCKEIKQNNQDDNVKGRPELSAKWIALLTIEKACLSTVSLEDTCGTMKKIGGEFKEKLREFGGLDAVFDVAIDCHSVMEKWSKDGCPSMREPKDDVVLQSLVLLLKCLKIMENATFLSKENQNHLLGMNGNLDGSNLPFTRLILSAIKHLSDHSFLQHSSFISNNEKSHSLSQEMGSASIFSLKGDHGCNHGGTLSSSSSERICSTEKPYSIQSFDISQKSQRLCTSQECSVSRSETTTAFASDPCTVKMRGNSSTSGSCNAASRSSQGGIAVKIIGSKMKLAPSKRCVSENVACGLLEDSQDPFAFDEDDFEPSKWDLLSSREDMSLTQKGRMKVREVENGCEAQMITSYNEFDNIENHHSYEISCSSAAEEENFNLLADCLLTAVKVLMNLTNDNPVGCRQIAVYGGLETMSSLIVDHFPSFIKCLHTSGQIKEDSLSSKLSIEVDHQNDKHLTDQELDFLVAILGLLVNLVEKDSLNRSRLAATSVSLRNLVGSNGEESHRNVIPLLCSIFLANQGAGEAAEDERTLPWSDEAALLQGEREAEKMIIEAYAALLLAFLSTESKSVREAIAVCLPDQNLEVLIPVLERFVAFHLTLNMISPETHKVVSEVIESCRGP